jgi:phage major head subunit gpT-like protein
MPAGNLYGSSLDSRDLIADFYPRLESTMESLWSARISIELPSDREVEQLGWLGQVPTMKRWVGGRTEDYLNKYTLTVRNYEYEVTLPISVPDLRRDKTGQIRRRIDDLAVRTATHWNTLIGTWITNGAGSTNALAYDGQFFFDVDHNESGTNQTNNLTATEVPAADVATTSTLTTTEAANIVTQTLAYMMSMTDDKGEPINQSPTEVLILCTKVGHYNGREDGARAEQPGHRLGQQQPAAGVDDGVHDQRAVRADVADHGGGRALLLLRHPTMGSTPLIRTSEVGVQTELLDDTFKSNRWVFGVQATRGVAYGMWQKAAKVTLS